MPEPKVDVAVIGGGFYGCSLARALKKDFQNVLVLEKSGDLLQRASYVNQARVHNGYHYPRSILTALRSRVNYRRYLKDYAPSVDHTFKKYYAVARQFSKVTAGQFERFCHRIEAPIKKAPSPIQKLFNPDLVENVYEVEECAFDAVKLKEQVKEGLASHKIPVHFKTEVLSLDFQGKEGIELHCRGPQGEKTLLKARLVFNCTYSQINQCLEASGIPLIPLKQELTEMALVEVPPALKDTGITVMCGPFFSCMPFPARGLHTLSHVRYTPHHQWFDGSRPYRNAHAYFDRTPKESNFPHMIKDVVRYLPLMKEAVHKDSLWEVKTVLPSSEQDDSRPILFRKFENFPGFYCVMGGKIDNIYDMKEELAVLFKKGEKISP